MAEAPKDVGGVRISEGACNYHRGCAFITLLKLGISAVPLQISPFWRPYVSGLKTNDNFLFETRPSIAKVQLRVRGHGYEYFAARMMITRPYLSALEDYRIGLTSEDEWLCPAQNKVLRHHLPILLLPCGLTFVIWRWIAIFLLKRGTP